MTKMHKKTKVKSWFVMFTLHVLFFLFFQTQIVTSYSSKYANQPPVRTDIQLLNYSVWAAHEFNQTRNEWVRVIVRLKDNSGIVITGTKNEKQNLMRQKEEWFKPKTREFLSKLSNDKFIVLSNISDGFVGMINKEGFNSLINDATVSEIHLDTVGSISLDESVPLIDVKSTLWNLGYAGNDVNVCIIDSGVSVSHPDLSGKIIDEYCYCSISNYGSGGCCPDNTSEDSNANDDNGHGTHVTGIVVSQDSTYKGVAYDANIYVVKITNSSGNYFNADLGKAIDKCRNWGVDIISMSLGDNGSYPGLSACPTTIDTDVNEAYAVDISLIAASGNEGYTNGIAYPACSSNVISVGMTYDYNQSTGGICWGNWNGSNCSNCIDYAQDIDIDKIPCASNRDDSLDLLAPGAFINSTVPTGSCELCDPSGFNSKGGTSMATPHVAGTAALMLQANNELTPEMIEYILKNKTGEPIYDNATGLTFSRIDAYEAIVFLNHSHMIAVSNNGTGNLSITDINSTSNWLSAYPRAFLVPPNSSENILATADPTNMNPGEYSGTLSIYSNDYNKTPVNITVTMKVGATGGKPLVGLVWNITSYTVFNNTIFNLPKNISVNILENQTLVLENSTITLDQAIITLCKNSILNLIKSFLNWLS